MTSMGNQIFPLKFPAGVKRDGTIFEGNFYTDGEWMRFQRGLPRKMGGYRQITDAFNGYVYGCYLTPEAGFNYAFGGSKNTLQMMIFDNNGFGAGLADRTPSGFVTSPNNVWTFDEAFDATSGKRSVLAHAAPNLSMIDNTVETEVYFGETIDTGVLVGTGESVSGGVVALHPYTIIYGNDGLVKWNVPNDLDDFGGAGSGNAYIDGSKIINGVKIRGGGGYSPAGLFWSLDTLIRATFSGSPVTFSFDAVGTTYLLSNRAVVEYDGIYYWPSRDRFQFYNGTIQELRNDMNLNFFYDNINPNNAQRIYGFKVPRYGEIWWAFPLGNSVECNWAVVYNIRENTWYDTPFERSSAFNSNLFTYPIAFGEDANASGTYQLWQHEFGVDKVVNSSSYAIRSSFTTPNIAWCANVVSDQFIGKDRWVEISRIEPDFIQSGPMTVDVIGQKYARSPDQVTTFDFDETTEKIDIKQQRREMRLKFTSNVAGGDYQTGETLLHFGEGDARQ